MDNCACGNDITDDRVDFRRKEETRNPHAGCWRDAIVTHGDTLASMCSACAAGEFGQRLFSRLGLTPVVCEMDRPPALCSGCAKHPIGTSYTL